MFQSRSVHCNFVRDGNRLKGVGVHPPPSPARADFSIMMGCTPEIGNRHSVYSVFVAAVPGSGVALRIPGPGV